MNDECTVDAEPYARLAAAADGPGGAPSTAGPVLAVAAPTEHGAAMDADRPSPPDPTETSDAVAGAGPGATRPLKLVLTLRPADGAPLRALLAVGADGCDPLIRSLAVRDLPAALAAVPALVAEAEARWAAQPRYPAVAAPPRTKTQTREKRSPDAGNGPSSDTAIATTAPAWPPGPADPSEDRAVAEPRADDAAQLSLFEPR